MTSVRYPAKPTKKEARVVAPVLQAAVSPNDPFAPKSRTPSIKALHVGQSVCECIRIDIGSSDSETLRKTTLAMKSSMSKAADRISKRFNQKFTTEVGDFRTRSGHIILVAVVTRLE